MNPAKAACRLFLLLAAYAGLAFRLGAAEIHVFAAASLSEGLAEVAQAYQLQTQAKIVLNLAASSTLARQIEAGAPADIFFSADQNNMDRLTRAGVVLPETRRNLLSNTLVIIVAAKNGANVRSPQDLAQPRIKRIALGDPEMVPIGVYARQYLQQQGLWAAVKNKLVATEHVRAAMAAVESGDADASIVYKTDAMSSHKVKVAFTVPPAEGPPISYPAAVVKGAKAAEAAKRFLNYLASARAAEIFQKYGFITTPKRPPP